MNSIIQTIIDALGRGYGRRNTPGWAYVLGVIISVAGATSTSELVKKRKALIKEKAKKLETQILRARLFSQEEGGEVEYGGCLRKEPDSYRLIIEVYKGDAASVVADVTKTSLDEMADYLRGNTKFILSDFKQ